MTRRRSVLSRLLARPLAALLAAAALGALPAAAAAQERNPNWTPPPPKEGFEYPDCYCTNRGERVEMGQTACLRIGSREVWARCGMSVNNPAWRPIRDGCPAEPSALRQLPDPRQPG